MTSARNLIILFLALAIPLAGIAGVEMPAAKCPMAMEQSSASSSASKADGPRHSCCEDAETAAFTGKLCKSGQECGTPSVFCPTTSKIPVASRVQVPFAGDMPSLLSPDPAKLLRPPRA